MTFTDLIYILITVLFFIIGVATGQEFINESNFEDKIAKDIVAVEFWVGWNESNEFAEIVKLNDCETYRVDIGRFPSIQKKYNVNCIPTVIIFESGEEKDRFKANIMFQLDATKKEVQNTIDDLMLAKFE
jgi:thioredoxin-like negative regulator of GroEL